MLDKFLEIRSLSLVLLGDFNPVIFSPSWLALKDLIREEEATNATVEVIHPDLTQYDLDWVTIIINRNRFELKTSQTPYFDPVRDLAISIFDILRETPLKSIGINHIFELKFQSKEQSYNFGAGLTNLDIWRDVLYDPKLLNLEIIEIERRDKFEGKYRVKISSSRTNPFGVQIDINDHINLKGKHSVAEILAESYDKSLERAKNVTENLLNRIKI